MKKSIKIIFIFLFSIIIFGLSKKVEANSISKIEMDIYINNVGDAIVTETWKCNTNQGTEVYHPYYNLGNSEIKDFSVREGNIKYTTLSTWNTSGTLESKSKKCGINKITNGVELCWSISSYSAHTYTATYTITKFVSALKDSQMIYWTLIPYDFSNSIGSVDIKIHTDFNIKDTVGVWGYGNYGGTAYVYNGNIEMHSDGSLDKNEYMTILVQFPSNTFNVSNILDNDFNYYLEMAEEGATKYEEDNRKETVFVIFTIIFVFGLNIIIWGIVGTAIFVTSRSTTLNFGEKGKIKSNEIEYFRDIPCKKDIFRAYYIAYNYGLVKNKTDVLGAIILKWIKDNIVKIQQKETGKIFKKENAIIILTDVDRDKFSDSQEKKIFDMLYEASLDGKLESKEFENWCKKNYSKILSWFDNILKEQKENLVKEGLLIKEEKKALKMFKYKQYTTTDLLRQEALELAGLKKYLKDYTLIKDREAIEVTLFEEYLIYAQLMGIAKEVAKEFKELYPEIIEESNFISYDNIMFINICTAHGISKAQNAKAAAESYSSGGGGFSSGGGGGGSFGGGGGRRGLPLNSE